jgi:dihydroorotase
LLQWRDDEARGRRGGVLDDVRRAVDAGVILDVGHGAGGMTFASAEALIGGGLAPHVISTDLHQMSHHGSAVLSNDATKSAFIRIRDDDTREFDLPECLSKFMALGMSLEGVLEAATARPAALIGRAGALGTLAPGAQADVGVFDLEQGHFEFHDTVGDTRIGTRRLVNIATVIGGREVERRPADAPAPWVDRVAVTAHG